MAALELVFNVFCSPSSQLLNTNELLLYASYLIIRRFGEDFFSALEQAIKTQDNGKFSEKISFSQFASLELAQQLK
jgi:hypothetical protein